MFCLKIGDTKSTCNPGTKSSQKDKVQKMLPNMIQHKLQMISEKLHHRNEVKKYKK